MKKIAIITGASSGMGRCFARTVDRAGVAFDEVWVVARRLERLQELSGPFPFRPLALDLTDRGSWSTLSALLEEEKPEVCLLVNAGGFGKFSAFTDETAEENVNMIDLNCAALTALCRIVVPYMPAGARIINFASVAAFQPVPYINVYAATKAYVLSFSRALARELRPRGISVTAVCPYWTATEFFYRAVAEDKPKVVKKYVAMYRPEQNVERAWRDALRGRDVSKFGFIARAQVGLARILPHRFVMWVWMKQQKLD